jgi:hypothetical protein
MLEQEGWPDPARYATRLRMVSKTRAAKRPKGLTANI